MAGIKKATHVVVHRNLYMSVGGKTQHIEAGTPITLTANQVKQLRGKVKPMGEKRSVDATPETDSEGQS